MANETAQAPQVLGFGDMQSDMGKALIDADTLMAKLRSEYPNVSGSILISFVLDWTDGEGPITVCPRFAAEVQIPTEGGARFQRFSTTDMDGMEGAADPTKFPSVSKVLLAFLKSLGKKAKKFKWRAADREKWVAEDAKKDQYDPGKQ